MSGQLAVEARHKDQVQALFSGHEVNDISSDKAQRKSGTDFLLKLANDDGTFSAPIRCENKFEQRCTGRQAFEVVSVDRPSLVPGWMFTSQAAWLLSWFPSGEVIALPMDQARELVFSNPTRHKATTADNRRYLTWNVLEDVDYVVRNIKDACVVDLAEELGQRFEVPWMLSGESLQKRCSVAELVARMRTLPVQSTPMPTTQEQLMTLCADLAPLNFCRKLHKDRLDGLAWLG